MPIRLAQVGAVWGRIRRMSDYLRTLLEFQHLFPDEAACARHLERIRWPEGFDCPSCSQVGDPWRLQTRSRRFSCIMNNYQIWLMKFNFQILAFAPSCPSPFGQHRYFPSAHNAVLFEHQRGQEYWKPRTSSFHSGSTEKRRYAEGRGW
jgi:hypothetical protein